MALKTKDPALESRICFSQGIGGKKGHALPSLQEEAE